MAEGFVKLYSSILDSSVWEHDAETRVVWITLLAMADSDGRVHASIPGIANRARVSIESAERALDIFQSPDEYSRSDAYEGRRIAPDGRDWLILNFSEHRARQVKENIKESKRKWWNENKGKGAKTRSKLENTRSDSKLLEKTRDIAEADPDAETDPNKEKNNKKKPPAFSAGFLTFWSAYPEKVGKKAAWKAWKKAEKEDMPDVAILLVALEKQQAEKDRLKAAGEFCPGWPNPATWLNQGRWEDEIDDTPAAGQSSMYEPIGGDFE